MLYSRNIVAELVDSLVNGPALMHIVIGPRQVGKTTAAHAVCEKMGWPHIFEAADFSPAPGPEWVESQWERARKLPADRKLLVLDEIQKVHGWSETVKRLWDQDRRNQCSLSVILLGSSSTLLHKGMTESLAGRFFLHHCMHWSYSECAKAFRWSLDEWLYFGGYPGAAAFLPDEKKWAQYIRDSLIETAIAKDVLQLNTLNKPALLRELFGVATGHPAQIFSYNKMLGQLHDAGNTTTLAHYLTLLETAYLASGLPLYSAGSPRRKAGSPKLILWNNALINASSRRSLGSARADGGWWGRLTENAVIAHFLNQLSHQNFDVYYWREGGEEVDVVITSGRDVWAIEIKSGRPGRTAGLAAFRKRYPAARAWIIGSGGIPLEEFFEQPAEHWLK